MQSNIHQDCFDTTLAQAKAVTHEIQDREKGSKSNWQTLISEFEPIEL